jgi:hypothetical protein
MPFAFYLSDALMLAFALAAAASAVRQSRGQRVQRWTLLLPGLFATIAAVSTMLYPRPRDLLELQMWTAGVLCFLAGGTRGRLMEMESDHTTGMVRLPWAKDLLWAALAFALIAVLHFAIEMGRLVVSPYMASGVLLMTIVGAYLLGRSVVSWVRAGSVSHVDLRN